MTQSPSGKKPGKADSRDQRLAAALRENLKRRKAQARKRAEKARVGETGPAEPSVYGPSARK
jgi:hypothetical protein